MLNGGFRMIVVTAALAVAASIGGWYGKVVWSHETRLTKTETQVENIHETLTEIKRVVDRVDERTRRWEPAR